jgi:hypothetical protein
MRDKEVSVPLAVEPVGVSQAAIDVLDRIAQASGGTREQVLAKAIAMIEPAVKARNAGKHVGVATDDTQLETEFVGF